MQAAHGALSSEREKLSASLQTNAGEQVTLRKQSAIQAAIIRSKEEELRRIAPVAAKGFISQMDMDQRRQSLLAERQRAEQLKQQLVQLATRRNETAAQLRRLPLDELRQNAELQGELGSLVQQRSRASVDVGYTILSPVDGRVTALQASPGRSVDPRVPLLSVLPQRLNFQVQLYAPSKAVGFIRVGQRVRISYDAFPYKQFGTFAGTIASISRTAYAPGEIDVPLKIEEPAYLLRVRLADETVPAFNSPLPLQSGMTLQGTVILERRSFVDWLLQPLNSVRKRT
jgi:membrane fusion protein